MTLAPVALLKSAATCLGIEADDWAAHIVNSTPSSLALADDHDLGDEDSEEPEPGSEQAVRANAVIVPTTAALRMRFIFSPFLRHR
ncbi:hypothetical protein BCB70_08125 [Cutibacterium modestum]|nr:hypothetical protein BCB70_08125 [Cutibacterium modestum]